MSAIPRHSGIKKKLAGVVNTHSREDAVGIIEGMLKAEYNGLEGRMKRVRAAYLKMGADDPARQNAIADLRLEAVEEYRTAYAIENFLADMGVDISPLMPGYDGRFEASSREEGGWTLSAVSLKENAMRTLGGHCNVIGDVVVLEKLLYDHTYLAAVMKLTDDYEPGKESYVEFDFYTVVFDEDVQALVKVPLDIKY